MTEFDEIVGADLQRRREALDALDPLEFAADRASILVLHPDGRVDGQAVLAGPSGPTAHARALDRAAVEAITTDRPQRWADVTWVHASDEMAEPAAALLAAWAPSNRIENEGDVPSSSVIVASASASS